MKQNASTLPSQMVLFAHFNLFLCLFRFVTKDWNFSQMGMEEIATALLNMVLNCCHCTRPMWKHNLLYTLLTAYIPSNICRLDRMEAVTSNRQTLRQQCHSTA